ncbi:RNA-binding protein NOB1 [Brevipalpus obovatus]|uniref:RNA-binding protein NOB1 n=1 Tax=Brevipalpus obovatus TaxID=246614 RepID=UPI003D9E0B7D
MEDGSKKIGSLVVDSSGFINGSDLHELADSIVTVVDVVDEIRDKTTRARFSCLPYTIKYREPKTEDVKFIADFARKTGDYASLSAVDLKLIALTYMLDKEAHNGDDSHLNKEPIIKSFVNKKDSQVNGSGTSFTKLPGFYSSSSSRKSNSRKIGEENEGSSGEDDDNGGDNDQDDGEDDEADWITPDNVAEMEEKMANMTVQEAKCEVACLTTDYSMQNVIIQLGLKVVSVKGLLIRETKQFLLRCFACFKITAEMERKFCPKCGNLGTLKRVAVHVNEKGEKTISINFKRPINIRGTKYSLPMPKGGKHSNDPILFEDQRIPQHKASKLTVTEHKVLNCKAIVSDPDYVARDSPFAINDVYSRASRFGKNQKLAGLQTRRNPNQVPRPTGNRKKSK